MDSPSARRALLALCLAAAGAVSVVAGTAGWTTHPVHGTAVLHAALEAVAPPPLGGAGARPTRGFHGSVFMHAGVGDFAEEVGGEADVLARRVGRSATEGYHVVELYGGMVAVGEYYAKINLGGQMVRTQIDTGSATLAVPMAACKSCRRGDRRYDLEKSVGGKGKAISCEDGSVCMKDKCSPFSCGKCSSDRACCSKTVPDMCGFHLSFGDGSGAQGMLVRDDLEWGGVTFPVVFGGINQDSPDFERQEVDGILGMAYPPLACNPSCVKPTFESMVEHLKMKHVFQICITSDSGRIVLGDWDRSLMTREPVWVDMSLSTPPTYYTVRLTGDLMVNDAPVVFPKYKLAIADSGTTLIVFARASFQLLVDHLQRKYCHVPGLCGPNSWFRPAHCTKIDEDDRRKMPTLRFSLDGGFDVVLTPDDYLINYESKGPDFWCVGIMALDSLSGGIDVIFGNTVMKKYITIYDRENKRIGFGLSNGDCRSSSNVVLGEPELSKDEVPVAQPALTAPEDDADDSSKSTVAAPPAAPVDDRRSPRESDGSTPGSGPAQNNLGSVFSGQTKCETATACAACAALDGNHCFWNSAAARCMVGDPSALMCTLDTVAGNVVYLIVGGIAGCLLLVSCVACGVCAYKKRQGALNDAAVDGDEAFESRVPLAPGGREGGRSFLTQSDDNDRAETF